MSVLYALSTILYILKQKSKIKETVLSRLEIKTIFLHLDKKAVRLD